MSQVLLDRIDELETQVRGIRLELLELRAQAESAAAPGPATRVRGSAPQAPPAHRPAPHQGAGRVRGSEPQAQPRRDLVQELRDGAARLDSADLLGAKALAWAGGIVTVLGVVFFFILAVNQGWLGPELRVA